jgi:hypothetical protein
MDMFKSEQERIAKSIDKMAPHLEDIGARGTLISQELLEIKHALKHADSSGSGSLGSSLSSEQATAKFETVKNELDEYAANSNAVIVYLTKALTNARYTLILSLTIDSTLSLSGSSEPLSLNAISFSTSNSSAPS